MPFWNDRCPPPDLLVNNVCRSLLRDMQAKEPLLEENRLSRGLREAWGRGRAELTVDELLDLREEWLDLREAGLDSRGEQIHARIIELAGWERRLRRWTGVLWMVGAGLATATIVLLTAGAPILPR